MECPNCSSKNLISIEYGPFHAEHYDGVSEYKCLACGHRVGSWTGKELKLGYIEPRFGRGGEPIPIPEDNEK